LNDEGVILKKIQGIKVTGSLLMEIQQQKISALLANNVCFIIPSQNNSLVLKFSTSINEQGYYKQIVCNRFALCTTGR
jgi:hypothetical protein